MQVQQISSVVKRALGKTDPPPAGLREPPVLSGAMPLIGHTVEFIRGALEMLFRANRENGEVAAINLLNRRMFALFGPDAHEAVFRAPDRTLNPQDAYKIMTPVFGKGMVYDAPTEKMNEQLKMLLPALKDKRMRNYGEIIVREVEQSIEGWGDSGTIDLIDYCRVLTNFTSSACLIGPEFREGMSEEFARVYHDLERGVTPLSYIHNDLPLPSFRRRDRARDRMVEMISGIVDQRRNSGRKGEDFLQTLMDAKYKHGAPLTDDEITGMLLASMFAGHHTSSVTTAWTLIELLQQPECLGRVQNELDATFGEDGEVSFASLRHIPETEYAVKESLRLHPPLFMLIRVVKEPFSFKGFHFPVDSWLIISPTVSHHIPEVFESPYRFDPQRFAPPREEDKRDYAYVPFGGGRHKCMGNAFALLQVKAILAVLLRRYEFELVGDEVGSDFHGLVIGPKEPCRIRYKRREVDKNASVEVAEAVEEEVPEPRPFKVKVDFDLCQSHAACMGEAPEIFNAEGLTKVRLKMVTPPDELYAKAVKAAAFCPQKAIKIIDRD